MVKQPHPEPLTQEQRTRYDRGRPEQDVGMLCQAPAKALRFNPGGRVLPCSQNTIFELGTYPARSLKEIWQGQERKTLVGLFEDYCLGPGCHECARDVREGTMEAVRSKMYDNLPRDTGAPALLDFKLESVCDLACVMCAGHSSSRHRLRRGEAGPPRRRVYDRRFVEELTEFLPSIQQARFTGGEPFLIHIYRDIWEEITRLNPGCAIWVQTSGSHIDESAKGLVQRSRMSFNFSIDSLERTRYEAIRRGSRFVDMQDNFEFLLGYTRRRGTEITVNTCVMRLNWMEIPDIVHFCNRLNIRIGFCIVWFPAALGIWTLPADEIGRIHDHYRDIRLPEDTPARAENQRRFQELTQLLASCLDAAHARTRPDAAPAMRMNDVESKLEQGCLQMGLTGRDLERLRSTLDRRLDDLTARDADRAPFVEYMSAVLDMFSADILVETLLNEPLERLQEDIRAYGDRPLR